MKTTSVDRRRKSSVAFLNSIFWALVVGVFLFKSASPLLAQQVTAAITGKVTDPSDAAVPGAKVAAKDVDRGTVWTTETNTEGFYNLPRVPVGTRTFSPPSHSSGISPWSANFSGIRCSQLATSASTGRTS